MVEGQIHLAEGHRDAAVTSWRHGLELSGGVDADLTWYLAALLLDLDRLDEAEPLVRQHRRLTGNIEGGIEPTPDTVTWKACS